MARIDHHVSLLFVPGHRLDRLDKALATAAGVVCVDLEDAVPLADKAAAREAILARLADLPGGRLALRINGLRTAAGIADLAALMTAPHLPAWLLLPMAESPVEIEILRGALGAHCPPIIALIETVAGLHQAAEIGRAPGVQALMLGAGDLSAQLGCAFAWEPLLTVRGQFVIACAEAGVPAIDVPYTTLNDEAGLAEETRRVREMGFLLKAAIHPAQIDPINALLMPSAEEIADAEAAITAYRAGGGQAVSFNGRMLEAPFMRRLERIAAFKERTHA